LDGVEEAFTLAGKKLFGEVARFEKQGNDASEKLGIELCNRLEKLTKQPPN
jgi:hypothetical protein